MLFNGPVAAPVQLGTGFEGDLNFQPGTSTLANVLWVKGKHNFNIGFEYRQSRNTTSICEGCPARLVSNRSTSLPVRRISPIAHPFALLGAVSHSFHRFADRIFRNSSVSGYIRTLQAPG
jgi:hypothetical protein